LFTGRRVDILDNGSLKIQYNRNRYYDYYTGRWLTHDPLGINPAGGRENWFEPLSQYSTGMNIYEYGRSAPLVWADAYGLCSTYSYAVPIWMAVPKGTSPADVLTTKKAADWLFWITLVGGAGGKGGPIGIAYALATKGGGPAFLKSATAAAMHLCGGHLYAYVCDWQCITTKKGKKKSVFVGCEWFKCEKEKGCGSDPTYSACDCDIYTYPIAETHKSRCYKDISDYYSPSKLHLLIPKDLKDIKKELKKGL
jgi:RHS repeat-associated protein